MQRGVSEGAVKLLASADPFTMDAWGRAPLITMSAKILTKLRFGLCGPVMAGAWAFAVAGMVGCRPQVEQTPLPMPPAEWVRQDNSPRLRELDFAPFERALAGLKKERIHQIWEWVQDGTVPDIQRAMAEGKLSAEELTLFFLSRIQRYDGALRSFIELNPLCLQEARAADRQRTAGKAGGPLLGIPVSVKDNIATAAPMHTTVGTELLLEHSPEQDAVLVKQLRAAGAVILGKAALSELAGCLTSEPAGCNAVSGMGVNPYGRNFPVSGSSSGSAIATSAYLTMLSVGTETSGSLISPGSMNGVVAMKPSREVVSGEGVVPLIRFQDSAGPVARRVMDAAALLEVIDQQEVNYGQALDEQALKGVAVGVLREGIQRSSEGNELWLKLIHEGLNQAGAICREVDEPSQEGPELTPVIFLGLSVETLGYMTAAGASVKTVADLQKYNATQAARRIPRGQNLIEVGTRILGVVTEKTGLSEGELGQLYERAALEGRAKAAGWLDQAFASQQVEVLVSLGNEHSTFYATAGYPAITVPLGLNQEGAPNGVTLIGKQGQDAKLLAFAYAFEQATRLRMPPVLTRE